MRPEPWWHDPVSFFGIMLGGSAVCFVLYGIGYWFYWTTTTLKKLEERNWSNSSRISELEEKQADSKRSDIPFG